MNETIPFIQSVVHATDLSSGDERAFAHALAIAAVRRARLTILHVGAQRDTDWQKFPHVRGLLEQWGLLAPGSSRSDVVEKLGVHVTKRSIASRFPALAITEYLAEEPADLLVVSTEGREGAARWLRGSVAEASSRWSHTMTLFVPRDVERSIVSIANGTLTLNAILIPIDHSPDSTAAIEFATRVAAVAGDGNVRIVLLHVGTRAPQVPVADGDGWTIETLQRDGEPVEAITHTAAAIRPELIVMPTAGRAGAFEALNGSTTERVLRRARCPLLAIPAKP